MLGGEVDVLGGDVGGLGGGLDVLRGEVDVLRSEPGALGGALQVQNEDSTPGILSDHALVAFAAFGFFVVFFAVFTEKLSGRAADLRRAALIGALARMMA